jgi:hydrophobe/amphiphile efflux-1 (HAE1) family protein
MTFTDIFIRRPVLATVISLLVLLMGLKAFSSLQLRQYPAVAFPTINITTAYPGASASLVKGFITTPILNAITSVEGVDYLTAESNEGVSIVSVFLTQDYDVDAALLDISAKVNKVRGELPAESEIPLVEQKESASGDALQYLAFSSSEMTEMQITDYLSKVIVPKLSTTPGMGKVDLVGKRSFAMRIWLNADHMAAFGLTAKDISEALRNSNFQSAAGQTKNSLVVFNVSADTSLSTPQQFEKIIVKSDKEALIRLRDVARVELGAENYNEAIRFGGVRSVFLKTSAAATANPLDVAERVRDLFPELKKQLPSVIEMDLVFDTTFSIDASIDEVVQTLIEASLIVVVVIFLFLGSFRSVAIPVITIPLSLIGVLSVMLWLGFSVNLLTLLAMVLAIGLVVDDAIVVVENIQRHIEEGAPPRNAALEGAREIAFPVIVMTITLAAVYLPIGFLGGLTGTLFTEFAFTLAGAVIVSGVIALTLSPMMCSRLLRAEGSGHPFMQRIDRAFDKLKIRYQETLHSALSYREASMMFTTIILISLFYLYTAIPEELAPLEDDGVVYIQGKAPLSANLQYVEKFSEQVEQAAEKIPERDRGFIWMQPNGFFSLQILNPWADRDRSNKEISDALQTELNGVAGLQIYTFNFPSLPGAAGGLPIQFVLMSTASEEVIYQVATNLVEEVKSSGLFTYVSQDLEFDKPELIINIDRDRAGELGITMSDIGTSLSILLGEQNIGRFSVDNRSYKVIPQVDREFRLNPEDLTSYYIKTKAGDTVPLSTVASLNITASPNKLSQFQQLNSTTIGAALAPGVTLGEAVDYLNGIAATKLPQGFSHDYIGQARQFREEGSALLITFLFSFVLIYLVLAAQFESFRDPIVVLISVPMSICGALIPMALGAATLNIYTQIGLVTLIGLISKHGILIVDLANKLQGMGLDPFEAAERAAVVRLRPVLMTTAAMVFGVVPLLLASGAGAEARNNIGLVIAAGMSIGTLFTLYIVPTLYTFVAKSRGAEPHFMGVDDEPASSEELSGGEML